MRSTRRRLLASAFPLLAIGGLPALGRLAESHPEIRSAVRKFEDARKCLACARAVADAWTSLGSLVVEAGYQAVVFAGRIYNPDHLHPECGDPEDDFGGRVYRSALILNLDS